MSIEITARHLQISQAQQELAHRKAEQLLAEFPKTEHIHIILDMQRHQFTAEFVVQHKDVARVEAREVCDDLVAGIDLAYAKVEKQLRKHREKVIAIHQRT